MQVLRALWNWVQSQILADAIVALVAERVVGKRAGTIEGSLEDEGVPNSDPRLTVRSEVILAHYDAERDRLRQIDDKAKSNLLGVTVAFSVVFAGFGVLTGQGTRPLFVGSLGLLCHLFLGAGVLSLILGGAFAIRALEIRRIGTFDIEDQLLADRSKRRIWLACIDLNRCTGTVRANSVHVSNRCIRNGIISLSVFVLLILSLSMSGARGGNRPSQYIVPGKTRVIVNGEPGTVIRYVEIPKTRKWVVLRDGQTTSKVYLSPPAEVRVITDKK